VGRTIFKWGIWDAIILATSANPSAVSPSPWLITTRPDWSDSILGETVMVVPERVKVDILDAFDDRDLTGVKVELERRKSADERRVRRMLEVPCNRFMLFHKNELYMCVRCAELLTVPYIV
jgi:hypothetical protein